MGQISSNIMEFSEGPIAQMHIDIDIHKPVREELKQLLNWSLAEIREIYAPFRKRKASPLFTRSEFCRFIQLSRISSFYIFDNFAKNTNNDTINVFEIVSILVMTSYTSYKYKLQFLFNVFDLECKKRLDYVELILLFKSITRSFCFLTGQSFSNDQTLDKFAHAMFYKADLNHDQVLEIGEQVFFYRRLIGWMEASPECLIVFKIFEPPIYGKQQFYIFNFFAQYTPDEIDIMLERIKKVYQRKQLFDIDYRALKTIPKVRRSYNSSSKQNRTKILPQKIVPHENTNQKLPFRISSLQFNKVPLLTSPMKKISSMARSSACGRQNKKDNGSFVIHNVPSIERPSGTNNNKLFQSLTSRQFRYTQRRKFDNIIIIKGRSITKKEVFQLREYFDNLAAGKKFIEIETFIENFNQDKYSHMKSVAASLFNFLDRKNSGKVQFLDLVTKLNPGLTSQCINTISRWSDEYNKNFGNDKKEGSESNIQQMKKRVLPKACITRLRELFKFFDTEGKGHVTIQNLKQILGGACSEKQVKTLFESSDIDKDGKLTLQQFSHVLLPPDLEIEGLKQFKQK